MARTATLPGVDFHDDELTEIALDYAESRDERMKIGKVESEWKQKLIAKMLDLKLTSYHDDERNLTITLETGEVKVKVKVANGPDDAD